MTCCIQRRPTIFRDRISAIPNCGVGLQLSMTPEFQQGIGAKSLDRALGTYLASIPLSQAAQVQVRVLNAQVQNQWSDERKDCDIHPLYPPWRFGSPDSPRSPDPFLPFSLCSPIRLLHPLGPCNLPCSNLHFPEIALVLPRDCWLPWCVPEIAGCLGSCFRSGCNLIVEC